MKFGGGIGAGTVHYIIICYVFGYERIDPLSFQASNQAHGHRYIKSDLYNLQTPDTWCVEDGTCHLNWIALPDIILKISQIMFLNLRSRKVAQDQIT